MYIYKINIYTNVYEHIYIYIYIEKYKIYIYIEIYIYIYTRNTLYKKQCFILRQLSCMVFKISRKLKKTYQFLR